MSLLIAFSEEERHSRVRCCVLSRLQALGLDVLQDPTSLHHIQVTCTDSSLLDREADRLRLLKYNTKGLLQEFEVGISRDEFKCDEKTGDLFSVSQRNFLLLSVIEQLTVDKAFLADVHREVSPKAVEEEGVEEGAELLESCLSLGIVESFFPPQPLATQHQQLFTQAIRSWPSDTQGEVGPVCSRQMGNGMKLRWMDVMSNYKWRRIGTARHVLYTCLCACVCSDLKHLRPDG